MIVLAEEDWLNSGYITIDSEGWHCSNDAPEAIKRSFEDFMKKVNSGMSIIEPDDE